MHHTYTHTYIHTTSIHPSIHTCIHSYRHTYIHACIHPFAYSDTGSRASRPLALLAGLRSGCSFAPAACQWPKSMRSAGCVALRLRFFARAWPQGLDFARSDGPRDDPGGDFRDRNGCFFDVVSFEKRTTRKTSDVLKTSVFPRFFHTSQRWCVDGKR